jgi:rhamnosyltransferase
MNTPGRPGEARAEARQAIVYCVIVCYRPQVTQLVDLCNHVLADGTKVIVVDNTEEPGLGNGRLPDGCTLISLGYNSGVAHAQNIGVAAALAAGAAVVMFLDQDSKVDPGFVALLTAAVEPGIAEIVSPLCVDDLSNNALPALRLSRFGLSIPVHQADRSSRYPVDAVISSGTVATREVFDRAGRFDEGLFIDFVDTEWCLRCRAMQIPIYAVPAAVMRHSIGSGAFTFGNLTILVHSSTRCYYQIRNSFLLLRKRHIPLVFSLKQIVSVILNRTVLLFRVEDRPAYIKAYLSAVRDGLRGVTGAKPD